MRALTGDLLLTAWDRCTSEHDLNRAVTMLAIALSGSSREQMAELSLGERNVLLLRLHEMSFGPRLRGFAACSQCGADLEFALAADSLAEHLETQRAKGAGEPNAGERQLEMRPVNTRDLLATLDVPDVAQAQDRLLARCLGAAEAVDGGALRTRPAVVETFERINAAAELSCIIACPACASAETLDLDLARFLWLEVHHAARRLIDEVDALAGAYGWSERSIIRMSPQRRGAYLEMLSA
jgi:hypothetical protein